MSFFTVCISIVITCVTTFITLNVQANTIITGRVANTESIPIAGVSVSLGSITTLTNNEGLYIIETPSLDIYSLKLKGLGYYASVHTFSHFELTKKNSRQLNINDIYLVKKVKGRTLFAFGGDVMMGRRYYTPYFSQPPLIVKGSEAVDTKKILEHIRPYLMLADHTSVNLETAISLTKPKTPAPKNITFYSPPEILTALKWAGVDHLNIGNNHIYDYLEPSLNTTLSYLSASGMSYSGAGKNQQMALMPYRTNLNSQDYAMLSYVGWPGRYTPNQIAQENKGGAAYGSWQNISSTVANEIKKQHAVIMQYHGGIEYSSEPTLHTEQLLKSTIDQGGDLIIGHHPHVSQGLELYGDKLIAYSLGNLVFDQYYYATQHAYMLYVWMDGETFYRAEIVPIYIKGYIPTPATGMHRYTVLKRLSNLSALRSTFISPSGGHGIITPENTNTLQNNEQRINLNKKQLVYPLYSSGWDNTLAKVTTDNPQLKYRLGTNLVNGSDFESFSTFNIDERSWQNEKGFKLSDKAAFSGVKSIGAQLAVDSYASFGMTNFLRVFKPNNPLTIQLKIKSTESINIKFFWQGRKKNQSLLTALDQGKKHLITHVVITGDKQWQTVEIPMNTPRNTYRSFRFMFEITNKSTEEHTIYIDDLALVEWKNAFTNKLTLQDKTIHTSYIGFNQQPIVGSSTATLTYTN
jgi:poly-gamma-glutamate capsule biosynthesis protein CapA/YwtB (metallophosphatase superfamily)